MSADYISIALAVAAAIATWYIKISKSRTDGMLITIETMRKEMERLQQRLSDSEQEIDKMRAQIMTLERQRIALERKIALLEDHNRQLRDILERNGIDAPPPPQGD